MWETICDAWACWSGWKFGPKFYSLPLFCNTEYPPPPENDNCQKSWHLDFSVAEYPPPKNDNCQKSWHFDFSVAEYPPPPKMTIVRNLGTLTFQLQNTPPPPPENDNCQKSWHLDFSVAEYPPPQKMTIVRNLGTLTFQLQNTHPPLPSPKWQLWIVLALTVMNILDLYWSACCVIS